MIRSLRKGSTTVELWYKYGSESIAAKNTEVELKPDHAIFRTTLKPVDGNQKDDADDVLKNDNTGFNKISFSDHQILDITAKFLNAYESMGKSMGDRPTMGDRPRLLARKTWSVPHCLPIVSKKW